MSSKYNNTEDEKISISLLLKGVKDWLSFLVSKINKIYFLSLTSVFLTISLNFLSNPIHYARTTFVLDNENSAGSIGDLSSLASLAGINASSFIDASSVFQIDNIQELYKSSSMIKKTLLSNFSYDKKTYQIIERFIKAEKFDKKWKKFGIDDEYFKTKTFNRTKDSLVKELTRIIKEKYLIVNKPSRKTTILEVGFNHKDEVLAKKFNENLVEIVNNFYFKTKTLKTGLNLEILQRQADSIKIILDSSIMMLAETDQRIPNPNPLTKVSLVPYQKAMIDVQSNGAIYQELLKQLELAKVSHRNKMPLIQIIDEPEFPLENSKWKLLKTIVYGLIIGFSFSILFFSFKRIIIID